LLLVVAGKDRISPPAVNKKVLKLQQRAPSVTERKDFPERCHYTAGQDGWEEVADYALNWALEHGKTAPVKPAEVETPARSS
jgi:hypothetical protein